MGDVVAVRAGWAIWSKHPGSRDDYSVLASSATPLSAAEFTRVLMHFAPGNAPSESGTPASLPWVMLSRVGVAEKTYLAASVQERTDTVDRSGRPISRTRYICVPYEDVAGAPVSYCGLSQALTTADLPQEAGALVPLTIPCLDPGELARTVMEFGPMAVASTAALLLSGPVTITGPTFPDTATRLRFLDAVAALLPYGYRASHTAATWSDTGAGSRFRMVFASRARDEASRVTWPGPARVPAGGPSGRYFEYLERVLGGHAVEPGELASLIGYLSRDIAPRKFEQPERAVTSIGEYFRAAVVGESVDNGTATSASIRVLFSRQQDGQLSADQRRTALGVLIADGDEQDWPLISERLDAIADGNLHELLPAVAQACRRLLWSTASKSLISEYMRSMASRGLADDLLAPLMAPPESAEDLASGLDKAGALLAGFVMDDPASHPRTQQALGRNPAAATALLAHLCGPGETARASIAVKWLGPVHEAVLLPFTALLNDTPGFVDPRALEALSMEGEPPSVRYMLRTASYLKRLQFVLPSLAYWLVWEAIREGGTTDRRFWNEVAMELTPVTAPEAAWLDLTLLATGNDPRSLYSSPQSGEALAAAWQQLLAQLREYGQAADERLTSALIDALGRRPWRTDQAQTAAVMDLTRRLTADGARPRLKTTVLDVSEALRQLPRRAPVAQLAQTCARAYAEGLEARLAVEALAESGVITSGAQATRVLEQLHRVLADSAVTSEKTPPLAWLGTFAVKFADGTFGEQTAAEFTACTMRSVREQLRHNVNLLWIAATRGGSTPPALNDADADHLERIGGAIEEMVREARKRPGGLITRSLHSITGRRDTKDNGE